MTKDIRNSSAELNIGEIHFRSYRLVAEEGFDRIRGASIRRAFKENRTRASEALLSGEIRFGQETDSRFSKGKVTIKKQKLAPEKKPLKHKNHNENIHFYSYKWLFNIFVSRWPSVSSFMSLTFSPVCSAKRSIRYRKVLRRRVFDWPLRHFHRRPRALQSVLYVVFA